MAIIKKSAYAKHNKNIEKFQKEHNVHTHLINIEELKQLLQQAGNDTHLRIQLSLDADNEIYPILSSAIDTSTTGTGFVGNDSMKISAEYMCPPSCLV